MAALRKILFLNKASGALAGLHRTRPVHRSEPGSQKQNKCDIPDYRNTLQGTQIAWNIAYLYGDLVKILFNWSLWYEVI